MKSFHLLRSIFRILLLCVCGAILGLNLYLANANRLMHDQMPMPFGYGAAVVLSGSMEPEFSTGDLIIVREQESYALRDIVVFQSGGSLVVHRIVDMDDTSVTTQGDANNTADTPIDPILIKGRVICHIDRVGDVVTFLKTPVGILIVLAAAIVLMEIPNRREKAEEEKVRQQIIDEINQLKNQ